MMKKKVWLVLLAMVLVSVLAIFGCGGGGDDDDDGNRGKKSQTLSLREQNSLE